MQGLIQYIYVEPLTSVIPRAWPASSGPLAKLQAMPDGANIIEITPQQLPAIRPGEGWGPSPDQYVWRDGAIVVEARP